MWLQLIKVAYFVCGTQNLALLATLKVDKVDHLVTNLVPLVVRMKFNADVAEDVPDEAAEAVAIDD
eukprot:6201097-Amphidinium_carterae.1